MFASRQIVSRFMQQSVHGRALAPESQVKPISGVQSFALIRRYHAGEFKPPTMDELPAPRGSWQELNNKRQRKYNTQLAAGIVFSIVSLVVANSSGLLYMNFSPPKSLD